MKKENVIKTCYSVLRKQTPLDIDCGKLCDGRCCKGDEKTGMILFPGEENLIDSNINVIKDENGLTFAVCDGSCDRNKRPLSCRIFPVFPVLKNEGGKDCIDVEFDLRADCPLLLGEIKLDRRFCKAVKRVGKYLLLNEETAKTYRYICDEINDIKVFENLIKKF